LKRNFAREQLVRCMVWSLHSFGSQTDPLVWIVKGPEAKPSTTLGITVLLYENEQAEAGFVEGNARSTVSRGGS
jgi:hypothetical protein